MMGPTKLSTIRAKLRKAWKKTDAELLSWFNQQLGDLGREPRANRVEIETLRLLCDALAAEAKRATPRRAAGRSKG
jgi:hypothetical protein